MDNSQLNVISIILDTMSLDAWRQARHTCNEMGIPDEQIVEAYNGLAEVVGTDKIEEIEDLV